MDDLFVLPPDDLSDVEDDVLSETRDTLRDRIKEVAAARRDPEVVGERTQAEVASEMAAAVEVLAKLETEIETREADEAAYDDSIAELAAKAGVETLSSTEGEEGDGSDEGEGDGDGEGDDAGDEAEGDGESTEGADTAAAQAVAASASRRPLPAARRHKPTPVEHDSRGLRVTQYASAIGTPFEAGEHLDRRGIGQLMTDIIRRGRVKNGQTAVIASATYEYPDEFILSEDPGAGEINTEKIQRALGDKRAVKEALLASGAPCAPFTPLYDLPGVETEARPVRGGLPSFQANRGGVIVGANPVMGDLELAVGVVTAEENAEGGTFAVKSCLVVECPQFESQAVDSIFHCRQYDNLRARPRRAGTHRGLQAADHDVGRLDAADRRVRQPGRGLRVPG